jgi:hypothetical protein
MGNGVYGACPLPPGTNGAGAEKGRKDCSEFHSCKDTKKYHKRGDDAENNHKTAVNSIFFEVYIRILAGFSITLPFKNLGILNNL